MKITKMFRGTAFALAASGMMLPQFALAAGAAPAEAASVNRTAPVVTDVALQQGGVLQGQVVDSQGAPQADSTVQVTHMGTTVAAVKTDAQGRFSVSGLRGGVHAIETVEGAGAYRLWAPNTAPPVANNSVLFVNDGLTQRANLVDVLYPGPFVQGMIVGGVIGGVTYWAVDHNDSGS